jgi:hypothetical protein
MTKILNFSRHAFNADQKTILTESGFEFSEEVIAPFFKDGVDFLAKVDGTTASVVVPSHILLEALSLDREFNFSILTWEADANARKREAFAVRGLKISRISKTAKFSPALIVETETLSANFQPTMENNFASNEAKPYGG